MLLKSVRVVPEVVDRKVRITSGTHTHTHTHTRVFQKNTFFEFWVPIFFLVYKCHKKFTEKISAQLEVI